MRHVIQRYISEKITVAVKQGFSAPDSTWFWDKCIDHVRDILYYQYAAVFVPLDRLATLSLGDEHLQEQANRRLPLLSLLSLEEWCKSFEGMRV